jgi:exopolysaccharide biosynthesis predicted pyruvyltransferase EpsI
MSTFFAEAESVLDGNYSHPFGVGFECELIQRAAKAQIITFLPDIQETLQEIWNNRDKEFCEKLGLSYKKLNIPTVPKENIYAGIEDISLIEAPLERWPNILIYARNGSSYQFQEDQFDTTSINLCIDIMCSEGPIKYEEIHNKEGLEAMELLDSKLQRLSDSVYMCIQKDKTLSGSVGQFEKPPKVVTSLPWPRKEPSNSTGEIAYIFQGKQFEFATQKITL